MADASESGAWTFMPLPTPVTRLLPETKTIVIRIGFNNGRIMFDKPIPKAPKYTLTHVVFDDFFTGAEYPVFASVTRKPGADITVSSPCRFVGMPSGDPIPEFLEKLKHDYTAAFASGHLDNEVLLDLAQSCHRLLAKKLVFMTPPEMTTNVQSNAMFLNLGNSGTSMRVHGGPGVSAVEIPRRSLQDQANRLLQGMKCGQTCSIRRLL